MPMREFFGGPLDGETKEVGHGDVVKVVLDKMPRLTQEEIDNPQALVQEPRIGIYRLYRRRDRLDYFQWEGEPDA